jgi:2-desacetyl-2-hydroxyethyl bacteriochlorophyllide A dehydrogenase
MKSIYFDISIPRILASKALGRVFPAVYDSFLSPVRFAELPDPPLPGPDWVRVKNRVAGICGADLSMYFVQASPSISIAALPGMPRAFLGHELIGEVVETGNRVDNLAAGDRVTLQRYLPCCSMKEIDPPCPPCRAGNYTLCENFAEGEMPRNTGAGFGDQFVAHRSQLMPVPDDISDDDAVLIEPTAGSLHAVLKRPPKENEKILVIGAGTIGLNVIQVARMLAPNCRIFVLEKVAAKKKKALALGADEALVGDPYEAVAAAGGAKLYKGPLGNQTILGGFDLIYDCVGYSGMIHDALRWLRARGDYILIGNQLSPVSFDHTPIWHQELRIQGVNSHGVEQWEGRSISSFELAMEMIRSGDIRLDGFITHRFPLDRYQEAFQTIKKGQETVIKAVLDIAKKDFPDHGVRHFLM